MQNNHKPQQFYPEMVFKIMSSLFLSNLKIQFSDRHNSLYDYSDFLARLFDMCRHGQYAETAYNSRFIKDAKKPVQAHPVRHVDAWCDKTGPVWLYADSLP